jgi:hypothetical protein
VKVTSPKDESEPLLGCPRRSSSAYVRDDDSGRSPRPDARPRACSGSCLAKGTVPLHTQSAFDHSSTPRASSRREVSSYEEPRNGLGISWVHSSSSFPMSRKLRPDLE